MHASGLANTRPSEESCVVYKMLSTRAEMHVAATCIVIHSSIESDHPFHNSCSATKHLDLVDIRVIFIPHSNVQLHIFILCLDCRQNGRHTVVSAGNVSTIRTNTGITCIAEQHRWHFFVKHSLETELTSPLNACILRCPLTGVSPRTLRLLTVHGGVTHGCSEYKWSHWTTDSCPCAKWTFLSH